MMMFHQLSLCLVSHQRFDVQYKAKRLFSCLYARLYVLVQPGRPSYMGILHVMRHL